jgi:hypothetical protein
MRRGRKGEVALEMSIVAGIHVLHTLRHLYAKGNGLEDKAPVRGLSPLSSVSVS